MHERKACFFPARNILLLFQSGMYVSYLMDKNGEFLKLTSRIFSDNYSKGFNDSFQHQLLFL